MIGTDTTSMNEETIDVVSIEVSDVGVRYVDFSCVVSYG